MNYVKRSSMIFLVATAMSSHAQEVKISLHQALDSAMNNNKELTMARLDKGVSQAKFKQTQATFLPQIRLSYTAMTTTNPLNAFGFKLQQQSITQNDFNPELLNNPSATQNFMVKAEWLQPLVNLEMLMMRQAAHEQASAISFKNERTKQYVVFQVEAAYAGLQLAHQAKSVMEESLLTIKSVYKSANHRYEKGYLQKSDVLQIQVQVAATETKLSEARSNVGNASDYLGLLMGSSTPLIYAVDSLKVSDASLDNPSVPADRADFLAMESVVNAQERVMRSGKMSYVPKLNAFGEYLVNDNEALGFGSNSYLVGAQLSWTLFNGMATRNKIDEQRMERDKSSQQLAYQRDQAQVELGKTLRQWKDARTAIVQQELTVAQASEALRILKNRYDHGLVSTNDLLQAQTLVSQHELALAQAVYQFNTTTAYLNFLTTSNK